MTSLSQKILTTLAYYDAMDYPMTSFEIWKYLMSWNIKGAFDDRSDGESKIRDVAIIDVIKELDSPDLKGKIEQYHGYYFLKGKKKLVEKRIERNKIVQIKLKIVRGVVRFLKFVPFLRMAAMTGTMAMKNSETKGDLDLLVILKHGHIFTGRLLVTFVTHILGKRRYADKITDRVCLNFFITEKSLSTDPGKIFGAQRPDINAVSLFCAQEHFFIFPVFDSGCFEKFQRENPWIKDYFENFSPGTGENMAMVKDSFFSKALRQIGEFLLSAEMIEKKLRTWQTRRIMGDKRTHFPESMVMADDDYLIFLPAPQGRETLERFEHIWPTLTKENNFIK